MKKSANNLFWTILGMALILLAYVIFNNSNLKFYLKEINNNYSSILNVILTALLVFVTLFYVVITYYMAKSSQDSLKETQRQLLLSKVPVITVDVSKAWGSAVFGNHRRQLRVDIKVKNIGDGPAIQLYSRIKFLYKTVEFQYYDELYEYTFIGNLSVGEEKEADMHFETKKIEKMMEDLTINRAKNMYRAQHNPRETPYVGTELSLELIYSNVHGQFFKSVVIKEIFALEVKTRKNKLDKFVYWLSEKVVKDNETYEVLFRNPIFQTNEFFSIDKEEAFKLIDAYKALN